MESKDDFLSSLAIYECHNPLNDVGELYPVPSTQNQYAISLIAHLKALGLSCSSEWRGSSNSINWNKNSWWWGERILPALTGTPGATQMIQFKDHFKLKYEHRGRNLKNFGL
jgi:hypothetical protein